MKAAVLPVLRLLGSMRPSPNPPEGLLGILLQLTSAGSAAASTVPAARLLVQHSAVAMLRAGNPALRSLGGVRSLTELARTASLYEQLLQRQGSACRLFSSEEQAAVSARSEEGPTTYTAPFGQAVGKVKKLSLFSCACALAAGPLIFGLDATSTLTAKASIAGTLATFGVFTTGLLQWFTSPYVQQLTYWPDTDTVEVTTLNLFAMPRTRRFHVAEAQPAETVHPLSSFQVNGKIYYLDADHFGDKSLLSRLALQQAAAHAIQEADELRERQGGGGGAP